jgi:hypothetical protein
VKTLSNKDKITERLAAWHETIVAVAEGVPNCGVFTYRKPESTIWGHDMLAKLVPLVEVKDSLFSPEQAENIQIEDFPGGEGNEWK